MHLALIISSLKPGGAERVLTDLANYWASKGHQITLLTLTSPEKKPFYPLDSKIRLIQLDQDQQESFFLTRLGYIFRRVFCLRKTLKTLNPDVVLSFVDVMNLTTLLASVGLNIPVIVSERTHPGHHKLPLFYRKLRHFLYPQAFRVVMQTQSAADYFQYFKNLVVISNVVKKPPFKKIPIAKIAYHITSVGRLSPVKGFETLIHAFAVLYSNYPHLRLTIYGEGTQREHLQNLINSLNLQEKVSLPGTTQDIHQKLIAADLFVFPSLYEGFPNALCEAMAVGLPVIASNCPGNIDIIRDGIDGCLFPVGDVSKLTTLMEALLNDPAARKRLGEEAKTVTKRFHPDLIFHKWDQIIFEAIKIKT